ncbi:MAG: LrgB family protein [Lawsonibacter sp.]|jgi:putative effector of murein hydrolase|nr:LrgB family protein [Lawsonibacter sp.]
MTETILSSPFFGLTLTCAAWCIGLWVQKRTGLILCNPLVVSSALIILLLVTLGIPYESYALGGDLLVLMQTPVTVMLALNVYQQRRLLGQYFLPVVAGCLAGSLASIASVLLLCRLMVLDEVITASLLPKSVTTAIAIAISESQGGIPGLTVTAVLIAGVMGAVFAPLFAKLFHITDPVAEGTAIGACSHGLGTAKAMELGPLQAAMSSIAICVCGIITSVLTLLM